MKNYLEITLLKIEKPNEKELIAKCILVCQQSTEKDGLTEVKTVKIKSLVEVPATLINKKVLCEVKIVPYTLNGKDCQLSIKALSVKVV